MADSTLSIRTIDHSEIPQLRQVFAWAFLDEPADSDKWASLLELDRSHAVFDGDEMIGTGGILSREITLPGGVQARLGAVTMVGVKPGHRRRGVASLLMKTQLEAMRDNGEALGALWASEGSIYRRFGYGEHATSINMMTMPTHMKFHAGVKTDPARIRQVTRDEAMPFMVALQDKLRRTKVGWLSRTESNWGYFLADAESERDGLTAYRYVVHPQGYAVFRVKHDWNNSGPQVELHVRELLAENDEVYAALYRFLLDMDLASSISFYTAASDPIQHMVDNPRKVQTHITDGLWLRVVDVERALPLRRYSSDVDSVIEIADDFCPWNSGRYRLTVKGGEAVATRTEDPADVSMDVAALGSVFLGGVRLSVLTHAQRVTEHTPGHVDALTLAFLTVEEPHCPEVF